LTVIQVDKIFPVMEVYSCVHRLYTKESYSGTL